MAISAVCVIALGIGIFFAIRESANDRPTFTINDTLPDGQGKKATIILLAGQSNASGCSSDEYLKKNVSEEKYEQYQKGYSNVYINYFASDSNMSNGFVRCVTGQGEAGGFFGPELGLAEKLNEKRPEGLFFIIKYAWGGTNLFDQWLSPSSKGKTGELYKNFISYVESSIEYLLSKNYDVSIEGMCWMQGESDSFSVENATNYEVHLQNFINDIRKEFSDYAAMDGIAFIDAYIADNPSYWVYCDLVNQSKREVAKLSELNVVIDTIAEGLSCSEEPTDAPDLAHYDSLSEITLGHLFGIVMTRFLE